MVIRDTVFIKSATSYKDCPEPIYPEYAFIGRSNVGKSSLINLLVNRKKMAKISSTPGKTQLINHFLVNDAWYLTDLPGFGFAKTPKTIREKWVKMIQDYLVKRPNLVLAFLLIDIRHAPLKNDLAFIQWLGEKQVAFHIIFTKSDKLGKNALASHLTRYQKELAKTWDPLPVNVLSSSETGMGRDEILEMIQVCNNAYVSS
jgi:GTP-binding protein